MTGTTNVGRAFAWPLIFAVGVVLLFPLPDALGFGDVSEHLTRITAVAGLLTGYATLWGSLRLFVYKKKAPIELIYFSILAASSLIICGLWWAEFLEMPNLGRWRAPQWWIEIRVWTLVAVCAICIALPTVIGSFAFLFKKAEVPGWRALGLCWGLAFCAIFFSLYATGDWMKGYRWMASLIVTTSPLFAVGLANIGDWLDRELSSTLARRLSLGLGIVATFASMGFGLAYGAPWISNALDLKQVLWPVDAFSASIFIPSAIAIGLILGWRKPSNSQWKVAGFALMTGGFALALTPQFHHLDWFTRRPETGPFSVKKRVDYNQYLQQRLHLEHASILDVDMGATMYWSGFDIVDIAGLVDVSMGHHWMEKPFIKEYIFNERKPTFAHVHGAWARTSKIPQHAEWKRDYIEVPGYPTSKKSLHLGNHIRRDLMMTDTWTQPQNRSVVFQNDVQLVGWKTAGEQLSTGRKFFLEVAVKTPHTKKSDDFRLFAFISGPAGELKAFDIPPGYDWYPPHRWGTNDTFFGRFSIEVPPGFSSGRYDLGFILLDNNGVIVPPRTRSDIDRTATRDVFIPPDTQIGTPQNRRFATGEIRFDGVLQISEDDDLLQLARNDVEEAIKLRPVINAGEPKNSGASRNDV